MHNIIWVGSRQSDIVNESIFSGSITRYGFDGESNISFCNNTFTSDYTTFVREETDRYALNSNIKFIFANERVVYSCSPRVFANSLCVNSLAAIESLNNKIFIRNYMKDVVNVPESVVLSAQSVKDTEFVKSIFADRYLDYVVQDPNGAGGIETTFLSKFDNENKYGYLLVTPYIEKSIPINIHIAVSEKEYRIFPPSLQILEGCFCYSGSDFIKAQQIDKTLKIKIFNIAVQIAKKIMKLKVKGIFGIDLLITQENILLLECNFRYQGSSFLINKALFDSKLPSYFMIAYDAFYNNISYLPNDIYNMPVNYSSFKRTEKNNIKCLPQAIEIKNDGDVSSGELRNGYICYELYNQSIIDLIHPQ